MRFTTAWAKTAALNVTLKIATITLAAVTIVQLFTITTLSSRDPLVIERSCYSRATPAKSAEPEQNEIKSFLLETLPMRFDTDGYVKEGLLSIEESMARDKEQSTLIQRQMNQRIVITEIIVNEKDITAIADRLISVGKIKSVLPLNLKVTLQKTNRTEANPYGLILSLLNQIEDKEKK